MTARDRLKKWLATNTGNQTATVEEISTLVAAIVAEENKACAEIADAWAMSDDEMEAATASDIANAIRRRME